MFECNGYIHIAPGLGQINPFGLFFQNHKYIVQLHISSNIFSLNDILTFFPFKMHRRPMFTLPLDRSRSPHGHNFEGFLPFKGILMVLSLKNEVAGLSRISGQKCQYLEVMHV